MLLCDNQRILLFSHVPSTQADLNGKALWNRQLLSIPLDNKQGGQRAHKRETMSKITQMLQIHTYEFISYPYTFLHNLSGDDDTIDE